MSLIEFLKVKSLKGPLPKQPVDFEYIGMTE